MEIVAALETALEGALSDVDVPGRDDLGINGRELGIPARAGTGRAPLVSVDFGFDTATARIAGAPRRSRNGSSLATADR